MHGINFAPDLVGILDTSPVSEDDLWSRLRHNRDRLLAATDWTQVPDASVDKDAWALYRAALRDLPAKVKDISKPIPWPTPPK